MPSNDNEKNMKGLNSRMWFGKYQGLPIKLLIDQNLFYIEELRKHQLIFLDRMAFHYYKKVCLQLKVTEVA